MTVAKAMRICIVSGEDSGDFHGANLARSLKEKLPELVIDGIGGRQMEDAGVSLIFPSARLAVVGITEVIGRLPAICAGWSCLKTYLRQQRPDLVVLIDFPDFNLYLAAPQVKKLGIPLVYYISPQLWAWRRGRIKRIRSLVDRMLVILPFEEEFYRESGVPVYYTGHPLADAFADFTPLPRAQRPYIALLPGSRPTEVRRLLPMMLETASLIRKTHPGQQFILPLAPSLSFELIESLLPSPCPSWLTLVRKPLSSCLCQVFFALVASGTATLETALAAVPMVVVYRVGFLSYLIGRKLISVSHISLVNLIAGREVVPELVQAEAEPRRIYEKAVECLDNPEKYARVLADLQEVKKRLGAAGGTDRAAEEVLACLRQFTPGCWT